MINTYTYTSKHIEIVGDLHCHLYEFLQNIDSTDTLFIFTGDLNIGKVSFINDIDLMTKAEIRLMKNNNFVVIVRGDHDNPKYFKHNSSFNKELNELCEHIMLIQDYSIIQCLDRNILCIGGARSINRFNRIKDYSFWRNETVNIPDESFYEELNNSNIIITDIVSHVAPLFAPPIEFTKENKYYNSYILNACAMYDSTLKNDVYKERLLLKGIYEKLHVKHNIRNWVYGHYHMNEEKLYNKTLLKCLNVKTRFKIV